MGLVSGSAKVRAYDMGDRSETTDAKGEATLKPVRPGYVAVQAVADGFAPNTGYATVGTAGAKAALTLTLHKGYPVSGRVIDEAGKPIAKASICVRLPANGTEGGFCFDVVDHAHFALVALLRTAT